MLAVTRFLNRIPGRGPHGVVEGKPVELRQEIVAILNRFIDQNNENVTEIEQSVTDVEGSVTLISNSVAENELAIFLSPFGVSPPDLSDDVDSLQARVADLEVQAWL